MALQWKQRNKKKFLTLLYIYLEMLGSKFVPTSEILFVILKMPCSSYLRVVKLILVCFYFSCARSKKQGKNTDKSHFSFLDSAQKKKHEKRDISIKSYETITSRFAHFLNTGLTKMTSVKKLDGFETIVRQSSPFCVWKVFNDCRLRTTECAPKIHEVVKESSVSSNFIPMPKALKSLEQKKQMLNLFDLLFRMH